MVQDKTVPADLRRGLLRRGARVLWRALDLFCGVLLWLVLFGGVGSVSVLAQGLQTVEPETALGETDSSAGIHCVAGECVVRLAVDAWPGDRLPLGNGASTPVTGASGEGAGQYLTWRVAQENLAFLPDGGLEFLNDVALQSPWGEIRLFDAELRLAVDGEYRLEGLRGAAGVEFPSIGEMTLFRSMFPARAVVGYERGRELDATQLTLDPARHYLYFDLEAGQLLGPAVKTTVKSTVKTTVKTTVQTTGGSIPGQKARLLLGPTDGLLFIDGQLMLYSYGQGALVESLLNGELENFEWSWDALPLRQVLVLNAQGLVNGQDEPFLRTGGSFSVDAGAIGDWLGLADSALGLGGGLWIAHDGMGIDAQVAGSIFPQHVLIVVADGGLHVPFDAPLWESAAAIHLGTTLPWAGIQGELEGSVNGALEVAGGATLVTVWGDEPVVYALAGSTSPTQIWRHTQNGWESMTISIADGYGAWSHAWSHTLENRWAEVQNRSWEMPQVALPTVTLPTVTLPTVTLPTVTLPQVSAPDLETWKWPGWETGTQREAGAAGGQSTYGAALNVWTLFR